jgi:hypothetical protein
MSQATSEGSETVRGEYTLIPIVSTPKISAGEKIFVEYYVAGRHPSDSPPENVRLNVNLDGLSVQSAWVSQNIAQAWEDDGHSLYLKKEEGFSRDKISRGGKAFSFKLPEAMFFPLQEAVEEDHPYNSPPIHGELDIDDQGNPPYRLEIQTDERQTAGDYEIISTLIYQQNDVAGTDRVTKNIHVNTTYEDYQLLINAVVILLTLIGVLFPIFRFIFI